MNKSTNFYLSEFGNRVRALREAKGLSQEELGALAGLHRTYIGSVERGERNVTLGTIAAIALALGVEPASLIPPGDKFKPGEKKK